MPHNKIDVLDEQGNKTGREEDWRVVHSQGLWHATAHIWLYNSRGEILVERRARTKDSYPNLLDISAAGHVDAGEMPEVAAYRELKEELGIAAGKDELQFGFQFVRAWDDETRNWHDHEIKHVYFNKYDGDIKNEMKLKTDEVSEVFWLPIDEFISKIKSNEGYREFVPANGREYYLRVANYIKNKLNSVSKLTAFYVSKNNQGYKKTR